MPLPVIPALFKELADERVRQGVSQREVAELCGVGERTVERWERLENLPLRARASDPGGDLARAVDGYSKATKRSPFDFWTKSAERAQEERKRYEDWLKADPSSPHPSLRARRAVSAIRRRPKS
jgi:transcriptional regulator with XRE-family HTH domain